MRIGKATQKSEWVERSAGVLYPLRAHLLTTDKVGGDALFEVRKHLLQNEKR